MTEDMQALVQRCIELSPTLQYLNDPANTNMLLGLLLGEFLLHILVFFSILMRVVLLVEWGCKGLVRMLLASGRRWQRWRATDG